MTTFEISKHIQRIILNRASEVMAYGWDTDFAVKHLRELPESIIELASWFKPIDPAHLSEDEMKQLGFNRWSEEDPMMLIPLWLLPFLVDEIKGGCISGQKGVFKRSEMDNDHRGGCLAYGVYLEPLINEQK